MADIARLQAITTQDVATEISRRNDLYAQHVHHQRRHASYQYSKSDIWAMLVELNIQDEQVMDQSRFYVSIQSKLRNYLGGHMSFT